jgi:thioredoxin 1
MADLCSNSQVNTHVLRAGVNTPMTTPYDSTGPSREQVDQLPGATVIQFGTDWCGYCQAAEPLIETAMLERSEVQRLKVEDGPGRPLGRSFRVKLWPTLIFLRDGRELARVVRPRTAAEISTALRLLG